MSDTQTLRGLTTVSFWTDDLAFDRHKHKIKASYYNRSKKLAEVVEGIQNENPHLFTYRAVDPIGIHTCLQLKRNIFTEAFIKNLSKSQISIDSIDKNYLSNFHKERLLKLNVSNVKEEKIEEGIGKVIEEIKRMNRVDFQFKKE